MRADTVRAETRFYRVEWDQSDSGGRGRQNVGEVLISAARRQGSGTAKRAAQTSGNLVFAEGRTRSITEVRVRRSPAGDGQCVYERSRRARPLPERVIYYGVARTDPPVRVREGLLGAPRADPARISLTKERSAGTGVSPRPRTGRRTGKSTLSAATGLHGSVTEIPEWRFARDLADPSRGVR